MLGGGAIISPAKFLWVKKWSYSKLSPSPIPSCPPWASPPTMMPYVVLQLVCPESRHTAPALLGQVGQMGTWLWRPNLSFLTCRGTFNTAPHGMIVRI